MNILLLNGGYKMSYRIIGVFHSSMNAEKAIKDIRNQGFEGGISLVTKENSTYFDEANKIKNEYQNDNDKIQYGGLVGGLVGLTVVTFAVPGIGTILAAGPLAGLFAGTLTGETVEAALNARNTEENKDYYTEQIRKGKSIVVVEKEDGYEDLITKILEKHRAEEIKLE